MYYLYTITDTLNSKVYVGQTVRPQKRWSQHKTYAKRNKPVQYIHRAMAKYGVDNFVFEIIVTCKSVDDANELETALIKQYDSRNKERGYNIAPGGETPWNLGLPKELNPLTGIPRTDEVKKKISENSVGKIMPPWTDERKKYMSDLFIGKPLTKEWVEKIAISNRGKIRSPETKMRLSLSHTGKTGENASNVKINWGIVREIRRESAEGILSRHQLALKYNVSKTTIGDVINHKVWKE